MDGCTIALLALLLVTPQQSPKPAEVKSQHQPPRRQTAPQPKATGTMEEIHAKEGQWYRGAKANGGSKPANPPADPWPDRFQGATALFTGLYFGATMWILCEMRRFNRRALLLSLASNRETKKAADAAKSSAETATLTLHHTHRAYLGRAGCAMVTFKVGKVPCCQVAIANSGRTPGTIIQNYAKIIISPDYPGIPPPSKPTLIYAIEPQILPDKFSSTQAEGDSPLTEETMAELIAGTTILHVVGRVDYRDVFGESWEFPYSLVYSVEQNLFAPTRLPMEDAGTQG
jgi:hypothetical protein